MEVSFIAKSLIIADDICDWAPAFSTVSNIIDIFQKCIVLPWLSHETIRENYYLSHIYEKSYVRCLVLLIPIINLSALFYDACQLWQNNKYVKNPFLSRDYSIFTFIRFEKDLIFKANEWKILTAMALFPIAPEWLRNNRVVASSAASFGGDFVDHYFPLINSLLRDDKEFMLPKIRDNYHIYQYLSPRLKDDEELLRTALRKCHDDFVHAISNPDLRVNAERSTLERIFSLASYRLQRHGIEYFLEQGEPDEQKNVQDLP